MYSQFYIAVYFLVWLLHLYIFLFLSLFFLLHSPNPHLPPPPFLFSSSKFSFLYLFFFLNDFWLLCFPSIYYFLFHLLSSLSMKYHNSDRLVLSIQNCRSTEKNAIATCYSMECASYNSNRPIRYCSQCNNIRHNNRRGTDHIVHTTIGSPWAMESQMQNFTIEAIVR